MQTHIMPIPDLSRIAAPWKKMWTGEKPRGLFFQSITFKNLIIFLPIFLIALAPLAISSWRDSKEIRIASLASHLKLIADLSVKRIDTPLLPALRNRNLANTVPHRKIVGALRGIQQDFNVDNAVLIRREENGKFEYIADGNNQFFIGQEVFLHERFPETFRVATATWEGMGTGRTGLFGFGTFEYLQYNEPIRHEGRVVALLLINKFAEDVDQAIRAETFELLSLTLAIVLVGVGVFWVFSSRLLQPLIHLKGAANRLAEGDLTVEIKPLKGWDEVALLNESFRTMVRELRESREELQRNNDELKRTLAKVQMMEDLEKNLFKFVPSSARKALAADPEALERVKTEKDVTVLFLDIEGSTVLTESMEPLQIDRLIEGYFSKYLDIIYENQGEITETAGDGLMIIFQGEDPEAHALNAVKAAMAIQATKPDSGPKCGPFLRKIRVNIGINSGSAMVGFTKYEAISGTRVTYTASGLTTILAARLQAHANGGNVLISAETGLRVRNDPQFTAAGWRLEDQGPVRMKNLNNPENVLKVIPPTAAPPRENGQATP